MPRARREGLRDRHGGARLDYRKLVEFMSRGRAGDLRVAYTPIVCNPRMGQSKMRAIDFMSFVMLVLRTVVLFNPLRVFLPLGGLMFLVGLAKFIYDVFLWNLSETAVMAFLAAVVVWSVGLLADMIARLQLRPPDTL